MKNTEILKFIFSKIKKCRFMLIMLTFLSVASAVFSVLFSLSSRSVIDTATAADMRAFGWAVAGMLVIIAVQITCRVLIKHFNAKSSAFMDIEWKKSLLGCLLRGEYGVVSSYHSGNLLHRMTMDVSTVNSGLVSVVPGFFSMIVRLISAVAVMAILDPVLTCIILAMGIAAVLVTGSLRRHIKDLHKETSAANAAVSELLQETSENMLIVRSLDAGDELMKKADDLLANRWRLQRIRKNIGMLANGGMGVICRGLEFAALIWCSVRLMKGQITFGTLTAMIQLVAQLEAPFVNFSSFIPSYISMLGSAERLKEICDIPAESGSPMDGHELYESLESIEAKELDFIYDDDRAHSRKDDTADENAQADPADIVLRGFNARIEKGDFAVILGPSGAGKSTFLKLLLGIYKPAAGQLNLNMISGEPVPVNRSTRHMFAFAPQGNLLFSGSLRDNLKLTAPQATDEQIKEALTIADMDEFIKSLPDGVDTVVGENAEGISEGQAQRINIARAVLSGAPVLLLDEVSSSLDADTEKKVLANLAALPGRTTIAVTHRPAALTLATRIIKIEDIIE